jgi:putative ABC transport system permease protein
MNLFRKQQVERDLDEELQSCLAILIDEKVAQGMARPEARRQALIELQGLDQIKEKVRDARMGATLEELFRDLRHGVRALRKSPGFAAVAVLTLAIGIGVNTAIFSVADTVLLRPLPYAGANKIVALWEKRPHENIFRGGVSALDFLDWRGMAKSFSQVALCDSRQYTLDTLDGAGNPERVPGERVTAGFFEALGVRPRLGRTFTPSEEQAGAHRVAVISSGMWQRRFAGDPDVLGRSIAVNSEPFSIVGVLPPEVRTPFETRRDLFIPLVLSADNRRFRGIHQFNSLARLKPGVTPVEAQSEMDLISSQLERQHPDTNAGHAASVVALREEISGKLRRPLLVLVGAVFLVVLIACANVANLSLARAASRSTEMAVRAALGASRSRLVRQSLAESAILALCGSAIGIGLGSWGLEALRTVFFQSSEFFSRTGLDTVRIDGRALLFTLVAAALSTLFFGASPALAGARVNLSGARGSSSAGLHRFRSALIVGEVALSLMLLTGAGLLAKSFVHLMNVNPGFQPERLLTAGISLPRATYRNTEQATAFYGTLLDRTGNLPGVRSAALTDVLPLSGDDNRSGVRIEGREPRSGENFRMNPRMVSVGYLQTMGIPLIEGRAFSAVDFASRRPVAVVSETAAHRYWPEGSPLGRRFAFTTERAPSIEVVGVAAAVHNRGLDQEATPDVYLPYPNNPFADLPPTEMRLVLRTGRSEITLPSAVRTTVSSIDPSLAVSAIRSMESYVGDSVSPRRFNLTLLAGFASIALSLAAAGLYSLMAYLVSQRTREIGIRMALGARPGDVLRLMVGKGLLLAGAGVVIGMAASLAMARVMGTLLYGVEPRDPAVFAVAPAVLLAVAALASFVPARRASRVDPVIALRVG